MLGKMKKHEYVRKNINTIKKLIKTGDLSSKILNYYSLHTTYTAYSQVKNKMERYSFVAEDNKVSTREVMRAVKDMESNV